MSVRLGFFAAVMLVCRLTSAEAQDLRVNVRGMVAAFDGKMLTVKSKTGADIVVDVPAAATFATTRAFKLEDVKAGMVLGVTTIKRTDGAIVAIDVRPIPATAPQGLSPWDLAPDATMTNAVLEGTVASSSGPELVLNYQSGTVKALIVPETAMSQAAPATREDVKIGDAVFVFARKLADGKLVAARVQVGRDGINPTQ